MMLGSSANLQVREENKNQRKSEKQEQTERKLLDMGHPEKMEEERKETNKENFESKSSLRIHKLYRAKLEKEKEVKPRIEGT
jgi:hypothetical protein